jgi:hypothetical protein
MMQLRQRAPGISASSSASASSAKADLRAFLLTFVCPKYTAEELKGSQSHLDEVMRLSIRIAKR